MGREWETERGRDWKKNRCEKDKKRHFHRTSYIEIKFNCDVFYNIHERDYHM